MNQEKIAESVLARVAGRGEEYKKYFEKKLKKWKVKSPSEIPDDKKDEFFEEVDKGWNSADEKGDDGKKASELVSLRDRRAGCEKLPEGGMRDNCEKKKEEGKKSDKKEAADNKQAYKKELSGLEKNFKRLSGMIEKGDYSAASQSASMVVSAASKIRDNLNKDK